MPKIYHVASFGNEVPSLHHTDEYVTFFSWLSFLLVSCVFFLQKPIGIIALLDEAWYNLFALWIGVHLYIALLQIISSPEFVFFQHVSKINARNILNQVVSALLVPR